jgi:hypothetical protein
MKKIILLIALVFSVSTFATEIDSISLNKTDEALSAILFKSLELVENTSNFAVEQAPDLLKEFYAWRITLNSMGIIIGILLILFAIIWFPKLFMRDKRQFQSDIKYLGKYIDDNNFTGVVAIGILATTIGLMFFISSSIALAQIIIAPKLYLIESIKNLIN